MRSEVSQSSNVRPGIDVLAVENFASLEGQRVGLLTHDASRDAAGRRTIDVLAGASTLRLAAIFSPEHGLTASREGRIASGTDAKTGLPVHSLYGSARRPTGKMLDGLDAIVIDLQDVGVRFYTYATTMAYVMEEAAKRNIKVVVLDRPNPIGPAGARGPVLDKKQRSFIGYFPMPVQHGMTIGELAKMFNAENRLGADLTVITMDNYSRNSWFDETGLAWEKPSPNLPSVDAVLLYPGTALVEFANVSVGRGTKHPFGLVGAPWINGLALSNALRSRNIAGVKIVPAVFTPDRDRYAGQYCSGIRLLRVEREAFNAVRLGLELAAALHRLYPGRFSLRAALGHVGSREVLAAIEGGEDPAAIEADWQPALEAFHAVRAKHLLYR